MEYVINMADVGFGITREDVMHLAYKIAENTGKQHLFRDGSVGLEAFCTRRP